MSVAQPFDLQHLPYGVLWLSFMIEILTAFAYACRDMTRQLGRS